MVSVISPGAMRPPPTPISPKKSSLTRPGIGLKRDSSFIDTDDEAGLSHSTKKLRMVAFDDKVDVRIVDDWNEKSLDLVREEVRQGIENHIAPGERNSDSHYGRLLNSLSPDSASPDAASSRLLRNYLIALTGRVHQLASCGKLVLAALDLAWIGRDDDFVDLYTKFLILLASSNAKFIAPIMDRLVSILERLPASSGRLPGEDPISREDMLDRLFATIGILLERVPSAAAALRQSIRHHFPTDIATARSHVRYQKHVLRLADSIPELKDELLSLLMERVVALDVQIQRELEDFELGEDEPLLQRSVPVGGNTAAEDSDDSDNESLSESELTMAEEEQRLQEIRLKVAKMDGTQDMLFEYFSPAFETGERKYSDTAYRQLLSHFDNYIMPNRPRHAQFLLFHFSQTSASRAESFADFLRDAVNNREATSFRRITAAAYLASFIARGAHIERALVQDVFSWLCTYLDLIRNIWEPNCLGPDRRAYSLYYALMQALLYIFCFRWRDLVIGPVDIDADYRLHAEDILADGRDLVWLPGIKETITRNVQCVLNPLKVCTPAIVTEFAKISNHLHFVYVFSLLERNKRVRLGQLLPSFQRAGGLDLGKRETAYDRKTGEAHHQLEAYFPFDPYQLPKSKRWVEGEYNAWKVPRGMTEDDDEDDEEDDEEDLGEEDGLPDQVDTEDSEAEAEDDFEEDNQTHGVIDDSQRAHAQTGLSGTLSNPVAV